MCGLSGSDRLPGEKKGKQNSYKRKKRDKQQAKSLNPPPPPISPTPRPPTERKYAGEGT